MKYADIILEEKIEQCFCHTGGGGDGGGGEGWRRRFGSSAASLDIAEKC